MTVNDSSMKKVTARNIKGYMHHDTPVFNALIKELGMVPVSMKPYGSEPAPVAPQVRQPRPSAKRPARPSK